MAEVALSLKESLAQRRMDLSGDHTFDLDLPGYSDYGLVVRYASIDYATQRLINKRHEKIKNEAEREMMSAADLLTYSCRDLLLRNENGTLESLERRINSATASELFGIELPEGVAARDALFAIVPDTMLVMGHFIEWSNAAAEVTDAIAEELVGESQATTVA